MMQLGHQVYPLNMATDVKVPALSLQAMLMQSIERCRERIALVAGERRVTYGQLGDDVQAFAAALQAIGVGVGDRVALMLPNCPEYVAAYYGTLTAGAVVAQINPMSVDRELDTLLRDSGAVVLVGMVKAKARLEACRRGSAIHTLILVDTDTPNRAITSVRLGEPERVYSFNEFLRNGRALEVTPVSFDPSTHLAALQYTGGTTGQPKAAMLTHRNLVANVVQAAHFYQSALVPGKDVFLAALPLFHAFGMTLCMNVPLCLGNRVVLMQRFDAELVVDVIEREQVDIYPGVPTMFIAIANLPNLQPARLASLRLCISGGGPLAPDVLLSFEHLAGCPVLEGYGLSETSPITHCNPPFAQRKPGTVGVPFPSTECRIVDLADHARELPAGQLGELVVRGPQVMQGYWRMPLETTDVLKDGWFSTGDLAVADEKGYISIVDRKKDMIIASGYNVYPREVEDVLYRHPLVREAIVVGVPDAYRGETVKACIVLKPGAQLSEDELKEHCRQYLAAYKVPTQIALVDELPKSAVGKLLRRALRT
ncbi:long-chain-fatty-acid--CoA ligase [Alicyclobacillus hesperidum]|uniref:Long-chain-fatty-acid--CoA ligase n=2 Tax=Alicyclobacillus hesperidum TaxID=89784 RepID=A0AA37U6C2_9BACL|nr:long-chain-fatty-acid--CoA ligase [Alicyclobacillus hesperidum]